MHEDHGDFCRIIFFDLQQAGMFEVRIRKNESLNIDGTILPLAQEVGERCRKIRSQGLFPSAQKNALHLEASEKNKLRPIFIKTNERGGGYAHAHALRTGLVGKSGRAFCKPGHIGNSRSIHGDALTKTFDLNGR